MKIRSNSDLDPNENELLVTQKAPTDGAANDVPHLLISEPNGLWHTVAVTTKDFLHLRGCNCRSADALGRKSTRNCTQNAFGGCWQSAFSI